MSRYPHKTFGWDAVKLYQNLSLQELQEMREALEADPTNRNPDHLAGKSIYIYTKSCRNKMDKLAWAVTYHLQKKS